MHSYRNVKNVQKCILELSDCAFYYSKSYIVVLKQKHLNLYIILVLNVSEGKATILKMFVPLGKEEHLLLLSEIDFICCDYMSLVTR